MTDVKWLIEAEARQRIAERLARASSPRIPSRRRQQLAARLHTVADRLES